MITKREDSRWDSAADALGAARHQATPFDGFTEYIRPRDILSGYEVQDRLLAALTRGDSEGLVGHKIGSTTPIMQSYLGIDHPCAGRLRGSHTSHERGVFAPSAQGPLGVECEIAVRMGQDLLPRHAPYERWEVRGAVGACMAAIEVVQDRYRDWRALDTPTLLADNFFNVGAVLGREHSDFDPEDLDTVTASMSIDGVVVGAGRGSDVLGHPLNALVWLANNLSERGIVLRAGDVVLLGSLVETHWVSEGSRVTIDNELLGPAIADFASQEVR